MRSWSIREWNETVGMLWRGTLYPHISLGQNNPSRRSKWPSSLSSLLKGILHHSDRPRWCISRPPRPLADGNWWAWMSQSKTKENPKWCHWLDLGVAAADRCVLGCFISYLRAIWSHSAQTWCLCSVRPPVPPPPPAPAGSQRSISWCTWGQRAPGCWYLEDPWRIDIKENNKGWLNRRSRKKTDATLLYRRHNSVIPG